MVLNVSSLLKTVKAVEDEHTRGTRAMESTVEAISQEIRVSLITNNNVDENIIKKCFKKTYLKILITNKKIIKKINSVEKKNYF